MAKGPRQRLTYRRRRQGETDYRRRLRLLTSRKPRAVIRISNKQVTAQVVTYAVDGDTVISSITGTNLVNDYKWPAGASKKSVAACYVAGYALAKKALQAGVPEAVLDIGLAAASRGGRVFSALKGMVDGGLDVPHGEGIFPTDERISGAHINDKLAKSVEKSCKVAEEGLK